MAGLPGASCLDSVQALALALTLVQVQFDSDEALNPASCVLDYTAMHNACWAHS